LIVDLTTPLWREADELTKIFVRSRETAREPDRTPLINNQHSTINNQARINNR
jgi:hypothetical protein